MKDKILITKTQARQFNIMLNALRLIHSGYQTTEQLRKDSEAEYGLGYEESLEMAYDNLQSTARGASYHVKLINLES